MDGLTLLESRIREDYPHIRSLLVLSQGEMVFERYFQQNGREQLHNFASGTKSFTSALIGILLQQDLLTSVQQRLIDFYGPLPADTDARMGEITIEHLLTMSSGLRWGESPLEVNRWLAQDDWLEHFIRLPVIDEPGTHFEYKPDPRLLSWIIERVTSESVIDFARANLFEPLDICDLQWPDRGSGEGIRLKPADIAKLGVLYLQGGVWFGNRLSPAEFVAASTRCQLQGAFPENDGYGYLWWVTEINGSHAFYASGFGGQYLFVIPDKEMVIVVTSAMDRPHIENKALVRKWLCSTGIVDT